LANFHFINNAQLNNTITLYVNLATADLSWSFYSPLAYKSYQSSILFFPVE